MTDKNGVIVGGTPPFGDKDDNNNHDMDNDVDVRGLCFQHLRACHQRRAQAVLALQPHDSGGVQLICHEDN